MFTWIKRLVTRSIDRPAVPLGQAYADLLRPGITHSGVPVTRDTVLSIPSFRRGVNLISSTVARLPLIVYRTQRDGSKVEDDNHPAYPLLRRKPSAYQTAFIFWQTIVSDILIEGNGYALCSRNSYADPTELTRLDPGQTYPVYEGDRLLYMTKSGNTWVKILPENILHFPYLGDGFSGYSTVDQVAESLGLCMATRRYGSVFFKNNASAGMLVSLPGFFKDKEELDKFKQGWNEYHMGVDKAHRLGILQGGATATRDTTNNEQAQFLQTREFEDKQIAVLLGLPPHKLGLNVATSYNSLTEENRSFSIDTISPLCSMIEQECEAKLLRENEQARQTRTIEFRLSDLERADHATEVATDLQELNNGGMTLRQYLTKHNRPTDDLGEEADWHRMPSNVVFMEEDDTPPPAPPGQVVPQGDNQGQANQDQGQELPSDQGGNQDQGNQGDNQKRLQALLLADVERQLTRVRKAVTAAASKPDFDPDAVLRQHGAIFVEAVAPALPDAAERVQRWTASVGEELRAVTRDQVPAVLDRLTAEEFLR